MLTLLSVGLALATPLVEAYPLPQGTHRVPTDAFGLSLGQLQLAPPETPVRTYDGQVVPWAHARVIALPMVSGDLQQCADAILRTRAEWLKRTGRPISFYATSGDPIPWSRVQGGEEPYATGDHLAWRSRPHPLSWEGYLSRVFMWAGTASLQERETQPVSEPRAGDVLVKGGFPGHATLILDVATDGERSWVLLGESFMPAQDFHVTEGPERGWWLWTDPMALASWTFSTSDLRRFRPLPQAEGL